MQLNRFMNELILEKLLKEKTINTAVTVSGCHMIACQISYVLIFN